jgi:cobalamin-dependent methionine synthase I
MLRNVELADDAPKIVLATPVGQWHELGLMAVAVEASECGWKPVYLGPDLPAEEIAYAVDRTGARALALYIAHNLDAGRLPSELKKLHRYLNEHVALFVGGAGCEPLRTVMDQIDALHVENAAQFRKRLRQLTVQD